MTSIVWYYLLQTSWGAGQAVAQAGGAARGPMQLQKGSRIAGGGGRVRRVSGYNPDSVPHQAEGAATSQLHDS